MFEGAPRKRFTLPKNWWSPSVQFSVETKKPPVFVVLLSLRFKVLLQRYTHQDDISQLDRQSRGATGRS